MLGTWIRHAVRSQGAGGGVGPGRHSDEEFLSANDKDIFTDILSAKEIITDDIRSYTTK